MSETVFAKIVKAISRFYDWLCPIYTHCQDCGREFEKPQRFPFHTRCHWT